MTSLTRIVDDKSPVDALPYHQVLRCPQCRQQYRFGYSPDEWSKVSAWLELADSVMRESHKRDKHKQDALKLA
jgi:hypothetical protein